MSESQEDFYRNLLDITDPWDFSSIKRDSTSGADIPRVDNRATRRKEFLQLTRLNLKTVWDWRIMEAATSLWNYAYMGAAEKTGGIFSAGSDIAG